MAIRRPARDLLNNVLNDALDSDEELPQIAAQNGRVKQRIKIHPASTDFSLDTLGSYLHSKVKENTLKEQKLRSDPLLARAEAEKENLRRLVNSNKPITATLHRGQLKVRESNVNARRGRYVIASEVDSDFHQHSFGASGSGSTGAVFPDVPNDWKFSSQKQVSPRLTRPSALQDNSVQLSSSSAPSRLQNRVGEPDSINNDSRARSFRQYTSSVRHSTRVHYSDRDSLLLLEESDLFTDSDEARPRKLASILTSSSQNSKAPTSTSDVVDGRDALDRQNNNSTNSANDVFNSTMAEVEDTAADDNRYREDDTDLHRHASEVRKPVSIWSRPFPMLDAPPKRHSNGKIFTDKDTFYSASSDDAFVSDQGEDAQTNAVQDTSTKGAENHVVHNASVLAKCSVANKFDYDCVVPEELPPEINQARTNRTKIWTMHGLDKNGEPEDEMSQSWHSSQYSIRELNPSFDNILGAPNQQNEYPRVWRVNELPVSLRDPPICPARTEKHGFPQEALPLICSYLSSQEVRKLRLVNKVTAAAVLPLMVRSTVIEFGRPLFGSTDATGWDSKSNSPASNSIVQSCGEDINKFGVSFIWDPVGLANAEPKVIEKEVDAWFGKYIWPEETYPRFQKLKELEDLVDSNRPLLKNTMKSLTRVHELALSVDSGHGWLVGPDISDLALFRDPKNGESKVFGKSFDAKDKLHEFAIRQYFMWGQINTLNAYAKRLANSRDGSVMAKIDRKFFRRFRLRSYDDFLVQTQQPDFKRTAHTGGAAPPPFHQPAAAQGPAAGLPNQPATQATNAGVPIPAVAHGGHNGVFGAPLGLGPLLQLTWTPHNPNAATMLNNATIAHANALAATVATGNVQVGGAQQMVNQAVVQPATIFTPQHALPTMLPQYPPLAAPQAAAPGARRGYDRRLTQYQEANAEAQRVPIFLQWPIIFNGYNITAEVGGKYDCVQAEMAPPSSFPYMPGELTEPQVQWLMETVWAQRAFLSAYTNSIITSAQVFKNVHSLNIAKLSSGLIPSLALDEFWSSLPNLQNLTLKISPDWRQEHVPGDKMFRRNMTISPVQSSVKLAEFLKSHIVKLENLSVLRIGFVGGGEHQPGLFARNRHVLPAPITSDPEAWLTDHLVKPDPETMLTFNHIRSLTFENCWFSPCMLEGFMRKSKDTSLHHLTLDSVSLTGIHDNRADGPLTTVGHQLKCDFSPGEWLQETIPTSACWVNVLENITPGKTILERKYDAEMIDEDDTPRPDPSFRGNIQKITLDSCGYVRISGTRPSDFAQNGLVDQSDIWYALDGGLEERRKLFYVNKYSIVDPQDWDYFGPAPPRELLNPKEKARCAIMMNTRDLDGTGEYFGLGKLTQCVHPIEKRVLERAWGMRFGWGDTMERFAAVEDGWFEGGTGRFSGTIERDN